jgi:calcium-dependent protein kinase
MGKTFSKNKVNKKLEKHDSNNFLRASTLAISNNTIIHRAKTDFHKNYVILSNLGKGAYSSVELIKNIFTEEKRAMKVMRAKEKLSEKVEQEIINEIFILKSLDHPNIIKIFEFYKKKEEYDLIMEYCEGGDLYKEIINFAPFSEEYTAYVLYQILSAVNFCHQNNVLHRDLKPENILICGRNEASFPRIKIGDFGTSKIFQKGVFSKRMVGSSYYIAPEVLQKQYNEKCDLWSCGVILYIMLAGKPPFSGKNDGEVIRNVMRGVYSINGIEFDNVSENAIDLIQNLLVLTPDLRLSAQEALNHQWFKEFNTKELYNEIEDENILMNLINNIKNYKRESALQETALAYLVHNFPQIPDVINASKLFNQIDVNDDGRINKDELYNGLKDQLRIKNLKKEVDIIFKKLDMDGNGSIEYEEFIRAAVNKDFFISDEIIEFAFKFFDKDNSGEITYDEIKEVFKDSMIKSSKEEISMKKIIDEVDKNGDGVISYEEFSLIMKKLIIPKN